MPGRTGFENQTRAANLCRDWLAQWKIGQIWISNPHNLGYLDNPVVQREWEVVKIWRGDNGEHEGYICVGVQQVSPDRHAYTTCYYDPAAPSTRYLVCSDAYNRPLELIQCVFTTSC
jgi:hypothetical protein